MSRERAAAQHELRLGAARGLADILRAEGAMRATTLAGRVEWRGSATAFADIIAAGLVARVIGFESDGDHLVALEASHAAA